MIYSVYVDYNIYSSSWDSLHKDKGNTEDSET